MKTDDTARWYLWGLEVTEADVARASTLDSETLAIADGLGEDWNGDVF